MSPVLLDALLAWLHFVLIFALFGCVVAEVFVYRAILDRATLERLGRIDLAYGILAVLVIGSGVARVLFSLKGAAFYLHNPIFWTKMSLYLVVALLSIPPTVHYVRLRSTLDAEGVARIEKRTYVQMRALLIAETAVLLTLPLCAALMARGFGASG